MWYRIKPLEIIHQERKLLQFLTELKIFRIKIIIIKTNKVDNKNKINELYKNIFSIDKFINIYNTNILNVNSKIQLLWFSIFYFNYSILFYW